MVKTTTLCLLGFVMVLSGCGLRGASERAQPQTLRIAEGRLGRAVSLVRAGSTLVAVYSDRKTAGLYEVEVPLSDPLPAVPPAARMIDRIDVMPPLSPSFGENVAFGRGNTVTVMYAARATEEKPLLKLASRDISTPSWTLDAVEPAGDPVGILPAGPDRIDLFWAAGSLLHLTYPGSAPPDILLAPCAPTGLAGTFSGGEEAALRGVTVYDSTSRSVFAFRWNGSSWEDSKIDGAGPIHSSLLLPDGRLAVLSWDAATRRLELIEENRPRVLVTLCADTNTVALLPGVGGKLLYLYDESRPLGGGRMTHELSLLVPGRGLAPGYRRLVLLSGEQPIADFSALKTGDMLYVLVHQDGIKLLGLKLPGGR